MIQKVCVINNGDDTTDFVNLLKSTNIPVDVTVFHIGDANLLESLQARKTNDTLDAIILTGSSTRRVVDDTDPVQLPVELLDLAVPVLGICYGYHWMVKAKGGIVRTHEDGLLHSFNKYIVMGDPLRISLKRYIFEDYEHVAEAPSSWTTMLRHQDMSFISYNTSGHFGVQFYPEKNLSVSVEFYRAWLNWANTFKTPSA
jgi:GMP synthase-like glutamine amidotransferase